MKFAPLIFAIVKKKNAISCTFGIVLEAFDGRPSFSFSTAMLTGKLHRYNHHDHHQGPPAHHHRVELTVSADEHGVVDEGQGREQRRQGESNRSRSQHLTLFSLLSFVFSPQLNFLLGCLSSLFAHSQHPPPPLHSSPFSLLPHFPKASKLSFLIKSLSFSEIRNCDVGLAIDTFSE